MAKKKILFYAVCVIVVIVAFSAYYIWRNPGMLPSGKGLSESVCKAKGGVMMDAGCGIAGDCRTECALPYKDGGKRCTSSAQCDGACVTEGYYSDVSRIPTEGTCQKYDRFPNCSSFYEIVGDGSTRSISGCSIG